MWRAAVLLGVAVLVRAERLATRDTAIEVKAGETAPFVVGSQGAEKLVPFAWGLDRAATVADGRQIVFVYRAKEPRLELRWIWRKRAETGPLEHSIQIRNLGKREVWIPLQDSFSFAFPVKTGEELRHVYIDKGAGKPSRVGTHVEAMPDGYRWRGGSSTYAQLWADEPREVIPWFAVEGRTERGWYVGVEFSGRVRLECKRLGGVVKGVVGLDPEPGRNFRTRLLPGEVFETPVVFYGSYRGGLDGMGNVLRPWEREVLGHQEAWSDAQYPLTVNNSWGSGMQVDEALALKMIRDSAELGLEMFHVDAGWFRAVGDWRPDPKKFPHGLAYVADEAHRRGLRFGIWVDWTQAGLSKESGALNVRDPKVRDWLVADVPPDWKPQEFKGQTIDLGVPEAAAYAQGELERLVTEYKLDMLEHDGYLVAQGCVRGDHPHAPPGGDVKVARRDGNQAVESENSTDVSYHAVRAYYEAYEKLRRDHPKLLLEICNDGGRMVDFGSAAHGDYFSVTDRYDPISNRQAFYDASHLLPAAMIESYVEKWPAPQIENFRYMLRSGMMGWFTLMLDTTRWTAAEHAAAKREIGLYRETLRPLIREADLYHVTPRPDGVGWDGIEYFDAKRQRGVLFAFRGLGGKEEYAFRLRGWTAGKRYRVRFVDGAAADRVMRGGEVVRVRLGRTESSEIVLVESED